MAESGTPLHDGCCERVLQFEGAGGIGMPAAARRVACNADDVSRLGVWRHDAGYGVDCA